MWTPRCFINATPLLAPSPPIPTSSVPGVLARSTNQCPQPSRLARLQFCSPQCQNVRKVFKEVNRGRLFLDPTVVRPCCEQRLVCQPTSSQLHPRAPRMPSTPSDLPVPAPSYLRGSSEAAPRPVSTGQQTPGSRSRLLPGWPRGCLSQPGQAAAVLSQADCSAVATAPCFLPHFLPAPGASEERQAQYSRRVDH